MDKIIKLNNRIGGSVLINTRYISCAFRGEKKSKASIIVMASHRDEIKVEESVDEIYEIINDKEG